MNKRYLMCILALILIFTACSGSEGSSRAAAATQQENSTAPSADAYVYYTAEEGLMRSGIDGSDSVLLERGACLRLIGNASGYIYFTDRDGMLYKLHETGERQKELLSPSPISDAAVAGGALCFIQSGEMFRLNADGTVTALIQIPEDILQQPYNLRTDGGSLYICTYHERGLGSIYKCDLDSGRVVLELKDVRYSPLVIHNGCAFQAQISDKGGRIYKQYMASGESETVLDYTGLLFDMSVSGNWLIYITQPENESLTYVNGFNLASGSTFRLESQNDFIYQTLPCGVLLLDSHDNSMSVLTLSGGGAYISDLKRN